MKKILSIIALLFFSSIVLAQTKIPIQLLNPAGSTAGQSITSTGPITPASWSSSYSGTSFTATQPISGSSNIGAFSYGSLSYTDTNVFSSFQCSVNGYCQSIWQNTNAGSIASIDLVVSNNLGTALNYYGNFGMNSSAFTGSGSFNLPNAVYMTSSNGDLAVGTLTSNAIHFFVNSGTTDAGGFSTSGIFTLGTALAITSGGTGQTTANAGFNSLSPMTTLGDTIFGGAFGVGTRLAGNTTATKNFLTQTGNGSTSAASSWGTIAAGDVPTLNQSTTGNAATSTTATNQSGGTVSATTLTASSTVNLSPANANVSLSPSGTGLATINPATSGSINNMTYGLTTPLAAKVTTLVATGSITPSTTNGIVGTTLGDSPCAGCVGAVNTITTTGTSLTAGISANIATITLTSGDWDICGSFSLVPAGTTITLAWTVSFSTSSASLSGFPNSSTQTLTTTAGAQTQFALTCIQQNVSSSTPIFLVMNANFNTSTMTSSGYIFARRRR